MAEPLGVEDARSLILQRAEPLEVEGVRLREAVGRVLAETAVARVDLPPFDSSAMDGFAARAEETPGRLRVAGRLAAGEPPADPLRAGEALGIATGAQVPPRADAVVPVERVDERDNTVEVAEHVAPGAHVRRRGSDVERGAPVVERGTLVEPRHVGALAAAGVAELACARRPRVAVVTTGSELRAPGDDLADGQIYDSNGALLVALVEQAGASVDRVEAVRDDERAHASALEAALETDVVLTSGGVSVGPHDLVRAVGVRLGIEEVFWRVAAKPGKPLWFGVRGRTLVFGLPGNPVSTLVAFHVFVRPALRALQRHRDPVEPLEVGRLGADLRCDPARTEYVRARLIAGADGPSVEPLAARESHQIVRSARADALVVVPARDGSLAAGSPVRFLRLR